jgi:hypothetical protein
MMNSQPTSARVQCLAEATKPFRFTVGGYEHSKYFWS